MTKRGDEMTGRSMIPLTCALVLASASGCQRSDQMRAGQPLPDACTVALAPAAGSTDNDREIARLQNEARSNTDARTALEQLGYRFVARARRTNDDGDYALADKTADCLASRYPDAASALLLKGHVLHQLHRFAEAEQIARRLVATREFVLDYGLLGDTLMDQGRLTEAAAAYQKMIDLKPYYQSYTRAAHLRWLKGDLDGAIELIDLAIQAASPRDRDSVAWAYTRLAAYQLQRGAFEAAGNAIAAALQFQPDYAAALLTRGRLLLAQRRPAEAVEPLQRAAALNPLPEYLWVLADTMRLLDRSAEADRIEGTLIGSGTKSDPRTLALFLATRQIRTTEAVAVAERELRTRADAFTVDALAWALNAAGRVEEANTAMTRALATGVEDGRVYMHAAVIADSRGDAVAARQFAAKAHAFAATLLPSELTQLALVRQRVAGGHPDSHPLNQ
jgi:tetratricopeptide (TPR) repeat protein